MQKLAAMDVPPRSVARTVDRQCRPAASRMLTRSPKLKSKRAICSVKHYIQSALGAYTGLQAFHRGWQASHRHSCLDQRAKYLHSIRHRPNCAAQLGRGHSAVIGLLHEEAERDPQCRSELIANTTSYPITTRSWARSGSAGLKNERSECAMAAMVDDLSGVKRQQ